MPRRFFFVDGGPPTNSAGVRFVRSNTSLDAKHPYDNVLIEGLVNADCLFHTAVSQNIVPFGIDTPFLIHLPVRKERGVWGILKPEDLMRKNLRASGDWLSQCEEQYSVLSTSRKTLTEALNYNNKLLVQNPSASLWVLFNAAGTNVSAAVYENVGLFWADQRTYWYCPSTTEEGDFLAAVLNAPSLNEVIKPFQSVGLAGERDIHKKVLELLPAYDDEDQTMKKLSRLGEACRKYMKKLMVELKGKSTATRRRICREHLKSQLNLIDDLVANLLQFKS